MFGWVSEAAWGAPGAAAEACCGLYLVWEGREAGVGVDVGDGGVGAEVVVVELW